MNEFNTSDQHKRLCQFKHFHSKHSHFLIQVELAEFVLKNKLVKVFRLWLYLKMISRGKVFLSYGFRKQLIEDLSIRDYKTLQSYLKQLKKLNWIGLGKGDEVYLRSFRTIRELHHFETSTCAILYPEFLEALQDYLVAVVIGDMINFQVRARWRQERKNRRSFQCQPRLFPYFGVSNSLISARLAISLSRARQLKQGAEKAGFISNTPMFTPLEIPEIEIPIYKKHCPFNAPKIRFINEKYVLQSYNKVDHYLTFRSRRIRKKLPHR
ncbi:MAG: hypothetical protein H6581_03905 [Bacteroidia bacterium]|nr:hypothetical protein [Bacteroidia bacterium]